MNYMTFPSSCSWCCAAQLLELRGIHSSDRALALAAGIPWRLRFEETDDCFVTGPMLQTAADFDRALAAYGLHLEEADVPRGEVPAYLAAHIPCMIGLRGAHGKHAMVLLAVEDGAFRFFDPHREGDGKPDLVLLSPEELAARLEPVCRIGRIADGASSLPADEPGAALAALDLYRERVHAFCGSSRTAAELDEMRDPLLRPVALDLPAMAELTGEAALSEALGTLREQIFALLRSGGTVPALVVDLALFDRCMDLWRRSILSHS